MNRRMRIDKILYKRQAHAQKEALKQKRTQTTTRTYLAMSRIYDLPNDYDTEDEHNSWGPGGLVPNPGEGEDYGGEAVRHRKVIDRALRRLEREESGGALVMLAHGLKPRKRKLEVLQQEEEPKSQASRMRTKGPRGRDSRPAASAEEQGDALDDLDLDLLGEGDESDDPMNGIDDSDDGGDATVGEEEEAPKKSIQPKEKGLLKKENTSKRDTSVSKDKPMKRDTAIIKEKRSGSKKTTPGIPGVEGETFSGQLVERLEAERLDAERVTKDDVPKKEKRDKKHRRSKKSRDRTLSDEEEYYSDGVCKTMRVDGTRYPGKVFDPRYVQVDDDGHVWDRTADPHRWKDSRWMA